MKQQFWAVFMMLLSLAACSPKSKDAAISLEPQTTVVPPRAENGGSTNVGSGGNGAEAVWKEIAQELSENIRQLQYSELDAKVFQHIRDHFSKTAGAATVEFKDYPLILGVETDQQDNPSNLKLDADHNCLRPAEGRERDAINFTNQQKIKVSRKRFSCYPKKSPEIYRLVLHEYLGLLGFDEIKNGQTQYEITNTLLKEFGSIEKFETGLSVVPVKTCQDLKNIGDTRVPRTQIPSPGFPNYPHQFRPRKVWALQNDIDCANQAVLSNAGNSNYLTGHFNGNGFKIQNLKLTAPLFLSSCSRCVIANLRLENVSAIDSRSILIENNHGKIQNLALSGKFTTTQSWGGGVVYNNEYGTIQNLMLQLEIQNQVRESDLFYFGGVAALNHNGVIANAKVHLKGNLRSTILGGIVVKNLWGEIRKASAQLQLAMDQARAFEFGGIAAFSSGTISESSTSGNVRFQMQEDSMKQMKENKIGGVVGLQGPSVEKEPYLFLKFDPAKNEDAEKGSGIDPHHLNQDFSESQTLTSQSHIHFEFYLNENRLLELPAGWRLDPVVAYSK